MADLLIDEGIGLDLVPRLRAQGFRIFHTLEFHPKSTHDQIVFLEAQRQLLTIFTWNRDDFVLLGEAWRDGGHGVHHGIITRPEHARQLGPTQVLPILERFCRDTASFVDRIELF